MPITVGRLKELIISQVRDEDGIIAANIDDIWAFYAQDPTAGQNQLRLQTKLDCIDLVIGKLRDEVDNSLGSDIDAKKHQKIETLAAMRLEVLNALATMNLATPQVGANPPHPRTARPVVAAIAAVTPQTPPFPGMIDANDSYYRGDVYKPVRRA